MVTFMYPVNPNLNKSTFHFLQVLISTASFSNFQEKQLYILLYLNFELILRLCIHVGCIYSNI